MPKLPDRWLKYAKCGSIIQGTRFIAFKTPLRPSYITTDDEKWEVDDLMRKIPRLGIVIDLTFSTKYYDLEDIESRGLVHQKILCEGHRIPKPGVIKKFYDVIDNFLAQNSNNGKLIGVHCTHGLNRTGFLVCRYMIDKMRFTPETAINLFERARSHKMERKNYVDAIRGNTEKKVEPNQQNLSKYSYSRQTPRATPPNRYSQHGQRYKNYNDARPSRYPSSSNSEGFSTRPPTSGYDMSNSAHHVMSNYYDEPQQMTSYRGPPRYDFRPPSGPPRHDFGPPTSCYYRNDGQN